MNTERRNKNRGYRQLLVRQDAIELDGLGYQAVLGWSFECKKLASQSNASADSLHRNIALGSLGETLSGFIAYSRTGQIESATFEQLAPLIFRLENRLLKLVESLERKRNTNDWTETLVVREDPPEHGADPAVTHDLNLLINTLAE